MVTTFLCHDEIQSMRLKALYRQRWNVELDLRNIKQRSAWSICAVRPRGGRQRAGFYLLAYNLIRLLMAQAACWPIKFPASVSFEGTRCRSGFPGSNAPVAVTDAAVCYQRPAEC